jgi:hypothetical protein
MKIAAVAILSLVTGYLIGNKFSFIDILTPEREIQFETDFIVKAGHKGLSRYYGTFMEPINLPIEITLTRDEFPNLKLVDSPGPK